MTEATLIRYLSTYFDLTEYMDEAKLAARRFLTGEYPGKDRLVDMMFEDLVRHFCRFPGDDEYTY